MSIGNLYSGMPKRRLNDSLIAVLGFGSQGRAIALNLRDSGYDVIVGLRSRSKGRARARKEGIAQITTAAKAVKASGTIVFALPDQAHSAVYTEDVAANLNQGSTLVFLHGMSVHFGLVKPPADSDVILVAPHGPGQTLREKYSTTRDISAFLAVHQDKSGKAWTRAREFAKGVGLDTKRLVKTTFEHEAIGDIFGEQVVLCGGLTALIKNGYDVLVEKGLPPENAYLEVAYQLDLIVDLIKNYGISGMYERISIAAQYGSAESGPKIVDKSTKKRTEKIYQDVASGRFARRLNALSEQEIKSLPKRLKSLTSDGLERSARKYSPKK